MDFHFPKQERLEGSHPSPCRSINFEKHQWLHSKMLPILLFLSCISQCFFSLQLWFLQPCYSHRSLHSFTDWYYCSSPLGHDWGKKIPSGVCKNSITGKETKGKIILFKHFEITCWLSWFLYRIEQPGLPSQGQRSLGAQTSRAAGCSWSPRSIPAAQWLLWSGFGRACCAALIRSITVPQKGNNNKGNMLLLHALRALIKPHEIPFQT